MLTRYRELYNRLTHSKAFKSEGSMNNELVNKKTFTPHNLKTIIIGANGYVTVRFTTFSNETNLVDVKYFTESYKNDADYINSLKEDKGMIDALVDGYKFNYLEEIIICVNGFTPDELNKEQNRVNNFILKHANTFKRLSGIYQVNAIITDDYKQLKSNISISKQLSSVVPITPIFQQKVERTELGLLVRPGLDSGKYEMDSEYKEDLPDTEKGKEKYRLSKYFYEEIKRAEQSKKSVEETKAKKEYDYQLIKAVEATIDKLDRFYSNLWNRKYVGIIHKDGVEFAHKNETVEQMHTIINAIYESWSDVAFYRNQNGNKLDSEDISRAVIEYGKAYIPGFHNTILASESNWRNKNREKLKEELLKKYSEHFTTNPQKINEIERGLTNCLIIKSCNKNQMILQITGVDESKLGAFTNLFNEKVGKTFVGRKNNGLIADTTYESDVLSLSYIFDYEAFLNEVLFAHKQYKNGMKPDLTNALLGLRMNGKPLTVNLTDPRKMLISIIAGSRSGKGTMTMGLLATLLGAGGSVIYLDNKPDIGAMLWDLEREYTDKGVKFLSLDMGTEYQEFTGSTPLRTGPMNLSEEDEDEEQAFRTLRMAKLFQLVCYIGSHSSAIEQQLNMSAGKVFFIADELTSTNVDYTKLETYVKEKVRKYVGRAEKQKATQEEKDKAEYYTKLSNILEKTPNQLTKGLTKDFGQSGLKIIIIGQELNNNWKVPNTNFAKSFAGRLVTSSHITFSGRLQATNDTFVFKGNQEQLADRSGVFNLTYKKPVPLTKLDYDEEPATKFSQFRSYFSLVKNDFNYDEFQAEGKKEYLTNHSKRFTTQFLSNYVNKDDITFNKALEEVYDFENGCNRDEVSFSGLIKIMQQTAGIDEDTLATNMSRGYDLIDAVFRKMNLGNYSCVEEYLCDCSPESLFTYNELDQKFNGVYVDKKVADTTDDGSFDLFGKDGNNSVDITSQPTTSSPINTQDRPHRQNQPNNTPSSTTPQPQRQQGSSTQPFTSQPQNNTQQEARQNDRNTVSDRNYYRGRIEVNDNPFTKYTNNTNIDTMLTVKDMTKILMDDIRKNVCPDEMITSFMIADGTLFINEIIYEPSFDNAFMNSLPQSLRIKVENGQMAEFFDLRRIYHYKNLEKFGLMDETLAQGRARKEMGIGFRKRWSVLFKKFKRLQLIQVGQIKYFRENPDTNEEQGFLDRFKNNPATTYSSGIGSGFMDKVWDSRPVRVLTGAMGWTVGVQATWLLASIMGPWGLLFGAFAMAGAMKEIKNSRNNNYSNNQASYQSQSYNQQYQGKAKTTQKKKNNKTNWND